MLNKLYLALLLLPLLWSSCKDEEVTPVQYDQTLYAFNYGALPAPPNLPTDNILTEQGVQLGRMLFYESMLSKDGTQSCASCHRQTDAFSDTLQFSIGVEGLPGKRQAMAIFNMAWHENEFFWDGRANLLRDQAILPIQDPLEMNETLENVVEKLEESDIYPDQFTRAFGTQDITTERIGLALEQFMLSIVSYRSKYDRFLAGNATLTASEERGRLLFETPYNPASPATSGADCRRCHGGPNFENDRYMNNGLDTDAEITDVGREEVTMNPNDKAKFKVTSLRNIAVTPPYMHDGRFQTLEQVVDHYDHGIQPSATVNPALLNSMQTGLMLSEQDKVDLVNFMKTLTDQQYLSDERYTSPF